MFCLLSSQVKLLEGFGAWTLSCPEKTQVVSPCLFCSLLVLMITICRVGLSLLALSRSLSVFDSLVVRH